MSRAENTAATPEELETLRHMLGINDFTRRHMESHRNHYCAGGEDVAKLDAMASRGLVVKRSNGSPLSGGDPVYVATAEGKRLAHESRRAALLPKKKRIYLAFLRVSDAVPDLTFGRFLTSDEFAEYRRDA